jgi:V/A-type H+-transporting ATPase subunit A
MLAGRLLRESVLQQSALSATDAYSSPDKTAALVDMVFDVVARARDLVDGGLPATAVEEADYTPLIRARERPAADGLTAFDTARATVRATLEALS